MLLRLQMLVRFSAVSERPGELLWNEGGIHSDSLAGHLWVFSPDMNLLMLQSRFVSEWWLNEVMKWAGKRVYFLRLGVKVPSEKHPDVILDLKPLALSHHGDNSSAYRGLRQHIAQSHATSQTLSTDANIDTQTAFLWLHKQMRKGSIQCGSQHIYIFRGE